MSWRAEGGPRLLPFETEAEAVDYTHALLEPHCSSIKREPVFGNGLRPDLGFRLACAPHLPLVVECKKFADGEVSALVQAIRQAYSYTKETGHVALIAPIEARGPMDLSWYDSPLGAIGLLAAQFSVGYLFAHPRSGGGIFIGGQCAVRFNRDGATLHSNAQRLLTRKHFSGSTTWRKSA